MSRDAISGWSVTTHSLKIWPVYFNAVRSGEKTFEIRENDRNFQRGDILHLKEWDPDADKVVQYGGRSEPYTGRDCYMRVTYVTTFAQKDGFVVMSIEPYAIDE